MNAPVRQMCRRGAGVLSALVLLLPCRGGEPAAAALRYPLAGNVEPREGTIEAWVRPLVDPMADNGRFYTFFIFRITGHERFNLSLVWDHAVGLKLHGTFADGESMRGAPYARSLVSRGLLTWKPGEWAHVALTWRDKEVAMFINGRAVAQSVLSVPVWISGKNDLCVGWGAVPIEVDELRVSATAMTAERIAAGLDQPPAVERDTLILDHLDELADDGRQTRAEMIAGFSGERGGSAVSGRPRVTAGRFGGALNLENNRTEEQDDPRPET